MQEKLSNTSPLGLYFHIPFCASSCDFCAFYQTPPSRAEIDAYLRGIQTELHKASPDRPAQTLFWGGGTPGILPTADLQTLARLIHPTLIHPPQEWTIELAPSTVKAEKLQALKDLGINRISLGIQSFQEATLKKLGRRQSPKQIYHAIELLHQAEIPNINFDLIIAIPGQNLSHLIADLDQAIKLAPHHISTYTLTFEEDTALYARLLQGQIKKHSDEQEILFYKTAQIRLTQAGYRQYEISNYARPGYACQHNINTWRMCEWIGFGPSAASQYQGKRHTNIPDLKQWLEGLNHNRPHFIDQVTLTPELLTADYLAFGLRMNEGVNISALKARFPFKHEPLLTPLLQQLEKETLILRETDNIKLTDKGQLLADAIGAEIIATLKCATEDTL